MSKRLFILLALAVTVALPFVLRPRQPALAPADDTVVIITPHNEAIRTEFGHGFQAWYRSRTDRKSTRLNSSHANISYAVFCLKKKHKTARPRGHVGIGAHEGRAGPLRDGQRRVSLQPMGY